MAALAHLCAFESRAADAVPRLFVGEPGTSTAELAFEELSRAANGAALRGDWGTALDSAREALQTLPEGPGTHAARADLVSLVGDYKLGERSHEELMASAEIVRAYLDDVDSLPPRADRARAREEAAGYLAAVELSAALTPPQRKPPVPADTPAQAVAPADGDPVNHSARPLRIAGGVAIGLGSVLSIAGLVFVAKWREEAGLYQGLADREAASPGSVTAGAEATRYSAMVRARGTALGMTLPGAVLLGVGIALVVVGTQRARKNPLAVGPTGLRLRF
jgi:hypothetical protein